MNETPTTRDTVLVVEDNEIYRIAKEDWIRKAGYKTRWTDATNLARQYINQGWVALLVLDIDELLKDPNGAAYREEGYNLLREIRNSSLEEIRNLPIIATTTKVPMGFDKWEKPAMEAGANAFLEEPFNPDDLTKLVRDLFPTGASAK